MRWWPGIVKGGEWSIDFPVENARSGLGSWSGKGFREDVAHCCRVLPNETFDGFFLGLIRKLA